MELIKPDLGLLFWMILSFGTVLFVLIKFAWRPILAALKNRERSISKSLLAAQRAREEMAKIEFGNEKITQLAKIERENLLKEAKELKNKIIEEARESAKLDAKKIIEEARQSVQHEKNQAINEIKNQIATLSVDIAEKILKQRLGDESLQKELINDLIKDIDLN
ncbi:MAG TPA: ATP synthase F0 subunit B [Bacteroidales bacterium]|jgi:F-type H+-transporting ATPase subunit b|nr:ATP synthase F0 subunit B [Bacteroidales bacterium]